MDEIKIIKAAINRETEYLQKQGYMPTALYQYHDANGNLVYVRVRLDHPQEGKQIRPFSRNPDGQWGHIGEPSFDGLKPLYGLPHITNSHQDEPVHIAEGEKCVNTFAELGAVAATSGGAKSVKDVDWSYLKGRDVIIWPDNDTAGLEYQQDVVNALAGIANSVRAIDVDALNLNQKDDVFDWVLAFKDSTGASPTANDVLALPTKAVEATGDDNNQVGDPYPNIERENATVKLVRASSITPESIRWLWKGYLARGKFHVFAGTAGTGKTTIAMAIAACVSTGGRFPDQTPCPQGNVLIWSGEDDPKDTLVPRLMAAGADLNRVHFIDETDINGDSRSFDPSQDFKALEEQAIKIGGVSLIIIDPIVNAVTGDSHKNGEVRRGLQPIVDFGEKLDCAILGITHFSKGGAGKDPLERVTGSLAFGALARVVLATAKTGDGEKSQRIFCVAKSNISTDSGGFEYSIEETEVNGGIVTSMSLWGAVLEGSARDLLGSDDSSDTEESKTALDQAMDFLKQELSGGEKSAKDTQASAKENLIASATLRRAKYKLGVKSSKSSLDNCWYWRLPKSFEDAQDAQDAHPQSVSTFNNFDENEHLKAEGAQHAQAKNVSTLSTFKNNEHLQAEYADNEGEQSEPVSTDSTENNGNDGLLI